MPDAEVEVVDSPTEGVADHIRRYVETDGADGHEWNGVQTLLLTTRGRKSGVFHRSALIYGRDGDDFLIVASKGGADQAPAWYLNLLAEPTVQVQVGAEKFTARARVADSEQKPALWTRMTAIWPSYDEYQAKTSREIPVVVLERR
jgi:deazaflavin-dependent oxidoreductase (nitroreductase family)